MFVVRAGLSYDTRAAVHGKLQSDGPEIRPADMRVALLNVAGILHRQASGVWGVYERGRGSVTDAAARRAGWSGHAAGRHQQLQARTIERMGRLVDYGVDHGARRGPCRDSDDRPPVVDPSPKRAAGRDVFPVWPG